MLFIESSKNSLCLSGVSFVGSQEEEGPLRNLNEIILDVRIVIFKSRSVRVFGYRVFLAEFTLLDSNFVSDVKVQKLLPPIIQNQ
jgi:hypothetical protein